MNHIPVFVISLNSATDRRTKMHDHLQSLNIDFEFVDAVDGRQLTIDQYPHYSARKRLATHGTHLSGGEIGCFLSHRNIYQKIVDAQIPYALILEDDCRFHEQFTQAFLALQTPPCDIIRFLGSPKVASGRQRKAQQMLDWLWLVRLRRHHGGAHAYLISNAGAQKMLKHTNSIFLPIDMILGRVWATGIHAYAAMPGMATQDLSFQSDIGDSREEKAIDIKGLPKALYPFTRGWFKLTESIGKTWHYWSRLPIDNYTRRTK